MSAPTFDPNLQRTLAVHHLSDSSLPANLKDWHSFLADVSHDSRWLNEILESAKDNIFALDPSGVILYSNRGFFGLSREALIGQTLFQFFERRSYRLKRALRGAFEEKTSDFHDAIYRAADGREIHFSHRVSPVIRGDEVVSAVVVATDITERKEMEKLAKSSELLLHHGAKMISLGEMAGGLTLEMNTPLTTVLLAIDQMKELLRASPVNEAELGIQLDSIGAGAARISGLFGALRTFSRDESNDPIDVTSVERIVENAASLCREKFRNEGVALRISEITPSLHCRARSVQVSQALLSLLNNAWDAARLSTEKWTQVEVHSTESGVQISVTDSGEGVPAAIRGKIFQPFFTTKEAGQGIGLGLSISRHLIVAMGGKLYLDEKSPRTRFVIEL